VEVIADSSNPLWGDEGSVITIGMYDGVHLGHRTVIDQVRRRAAELGARSVVVTFDRHPMSVVRPESAPKLLTNLEQRLELLAATGVDATVVVSFNDEQSHETAVGFVERVIVGALGARAVIVGSDFHFGHMRQGNVTLLREMGERHGFTAEPVTLVPRADGIDEPVSSTAIRRALAGGEIDTANRMLGRPHEIRGTVIDGDKRGRTIGFPTANVAVADGMCIPADGVYAAVYRRPDGSEHPAAVNIGRRPTFYNDAQHSLIEAHLIDFTGDIYGEQAAVQFVAFIRSEKRFAGIDELKNQLVSDIARCLGALEARGPAS